MKITIQLINRLNNHYYYNSNKKLFLILCMLFHNKIINKEQLKAYFKQLRENKLDRYLHTYHSKIDGKWYNDVYMVDIMQGYLNSSKNLSEIGIDDLLKYTNLFLNEKRNSCINWLFYEYIDALIHEYSSITSSDTCLELIKMFGFDISLDVKSYNDNNWHYSFGYCCEDCDGDFEDYKRSRWIYDIGRENAMKIREQISDQLNTKRHNSYLKNLNFMKNNYILL